MTDKNKEVEKYNGPCFDDCYNYYDSPDKWKKQAGPGRMETLFKAKKIMVLEEMNIENVVVPFLEKTNLNINLTIFELIGVEELSAAIDRFKKENEDLFLYEPDYSRKFWVESE